jgi:hypothetical protein
LAGAGVYTYTVNAIAPCTGTDVSTVTVTEQAQPNAGTNGSLTICSSTTLTTALLYGALGGSPDPGGSWSPAPAGAGSYTYTVNAVSPCTVNATATVNVTVQAAPNATIAYSAATYTTADPVQSVTITGTPNTGTFSAPAGLSINPVNGDITPSTSTAPGTYLVTYTVPASGACPLYTATTTVTINPFVLTVLDCATPLDFSSPVLLSPTQAPGVWYVDRYAPNGFAISGDLGGSTLKHSINAADGQPGTSLPAIGFYNTQGRKYDLQAATTTLKIKLWVPSSWATSGRRMAGLWGTAFDISNAVSGYPIIEFSANSEGTGVPRFRCYETGTGVWHDMGLPAGFVYDSWVDLSIKLRADGEFQYKAGNLSYTTTTGAPDASKYIGNVILQGYNLTSGVTYDIYWDDLASNTVSLIINNPVGACPSVNLTLPAVTAGSVFPIGTTLGYFTNPAATIVVPDPTQVGTGTYYIKATAPGGCFDVQPVTVSIPGTVHNVTQLTDHCTIQAAIDAANPGDHIKVDAGTYFESASNRYVFGVNGPHKFGLFIDKDNLIIEGLDAGNNTVTNASNAAAVVTTNATNNFGASGIFVQANGVTIKGLKIGDNYDDLNVLNNNKTIEVVGNNFTLDKTWISTATDEGAVYMGRWDAAHPISSYSLTDNRFENTLVSINNGVGLTGPRAGRVITGNTFVGVATPYLIGFRGWNGAGPVQGWIVDPVGGAVVTGNTFNTTGVVNYIVARGNAGGYVNSELDWSEMWNLNTYGNHVVTVTNYPGWDVRTYTDGAGYPETRRISPAIQENITIAASGDAVLVGNGTYNEAVTIDKSLTLKGYSGNKALHVINGTGLGINNGITINAGISNVTIRDVTVQNFTGASGNANAGIYGISANNNLTIDNVALLNNPTASGFYANGPVSNVAISNSTVSNNGGGARGIVIWNGLKQNISITNNIVINNSCCGIELQDGDASAVNVSGNTIDIGSGDNAIGLVGLNPSVGPNTVNNNNITGGGRFGIEIKNPAGGVTVSGNQVNMTVQNGDLRDRAGIAAFRRSVTGGNVNIPNGVSITGNTVTGYQQTSVSEGFGIVIEGTNHTVTGNTVTGCDVGILQQQNPSNYPGDADQSNLADIYFGRGNSPTTCGNTISGNTLSNTLNTRDANISGGVVLNTTTLKTYCSIQPAIDDPLTLNGHTLQVQAGTYNESLNINKSLTLEGAQANVCAPTRSGAETIINCVNGIGINASGVTLNGFTIQGQTSAAGPGFGYAVYMAPGNTGTKLLNNIIKDNVIGSSLSNQGASPAQVQITCNWFKDNNNPGAATGSGIYTDEYVSGGIFSNVLINDNKFSGNNSAGIDISVTQPTLACTGVTINGNEFSNNYRATFLYNVTNSSFTNNEVSGSFFATSGDVRIYGGVINFNIANNKFAAGTNIRAIRISNVGAGSNSGITVNYNSFTGYSASDNAIEVLAGSYPGNLAATCNWFGSTVPATVAAQITGAVSYIPYLTSGADASAAIGFQTTEVCTACALVATPSSTNVTCPTQADGTASVTLTGGTGPYTYDWGVYGSTQTITGLAAGSYPVTVTDINGCTATATAVVGGILTGPVQNVQTGLYYCTIQAAIDAPQTVNGNTLQVSAGLYKENVVVNKSVSILGPNAAVNACSGTRVAEAIVVPAGAAISSGEIFHVAASNVTISGLTIDGDNTSVLSGFTSTNGADIDAAEGITVYETGVNNLTVTNNIIKNLSYFGVTLYDYPAAVPSSGHVISNNKIQDLGTYDAGSGISYWGGGVLLYNNQYAAVTNNCMTNVRIGVQTGNFHLANPGTTASQVISGNTIQARRRGIFHNLFYGSASAYTLSGNTITALADLNETGAWDGILLASMQNTASTAANNSINGAGVTAVPKTGIHVWNCQVAPLISGGTIVDVGTGINVNNFEGYPTAGSNAGNTSATIDGVSISSITTAGIKIQDSPSNNNGATVFAEVKNTTITGGATGILVSGADATANVHDNPSTITLSGIGIDVDGGTATVHRNNITANGIGVRATNGGQLTSVTENFITNNTSDGILITATAGVIGNINTNNLAGNSSKAINNQSAATLAATCNWYGATLPATVATKISGPVTYAPYLTTGVDEQPGTNGFQNTSCKTVVFADPALVDVNITDLSDVLVNANLLPLNSVNRVHVPVLNLDQDPLHIVPAGTTKIRLDLGNKMILDPSFNLATAPLSTFFNWSKVVESGNDVIYGDQIADLPPSFVGDAYFQTIATIPGTSKDTATFQVTNHNNPTLFLIDAVVGNNEAKLQYTVLNAFTITLDNTSDVTCFGGNNGSITVHANGGAVPYQYSIDGGTTWVPAVPTAGGHTFNGLTAGTYTIKARDFLSQIVTLVPNVVISQPAVLSATVSSTNVTCFGANDGTITISSPTGGHGNYQYSINGGGAWSNTGSFTGLTPNTYNVQIRDADYPTCVIVLNASLQITEPPVLSATVSSTNVTCFGSNNGTITVSGATGGYGTYEYRLDAGTWQSGGSFTGLAPATYSVQIRDAAHPTCVIVLGSVTITQPAVLSATVSSTNVTCFGANNGTITISAPTGGYGTYEYRLDAGAWQSSGSFTGLAPATYSVQIRDAAQPACVIVLNASLQITEPAILSATVNSTNVTCNGANNGTITISAPTGGYGTYEYRLDAGAWQSGGSFTGLAPATYSVQIRDAAHTSCVIVLGSVTITEPGVLSATISSTNVLCNGAANGTITVNGATGGYGTYEYRLDAGAWQISNVFTGLAPATYSVQIRDAAYPGCAQTLGSVTITEPTVLNASVTAINHVLCAGSSSGSVTVTATGGTPGYTYNLDGGPFLANGGTFTGLAAGPHTVVAKDANGCLKPVTFTITEPLHTDITLGSVFDSNIFTAIGQEITVVYNITEIAGKAATPAVLRIFKPAGYDVLFDNSQTTMMSLAVDNQKWVMTTSNSLYYEFSRTGPGGNNTINCSEFLRLGFKVKRNTFNVSTFNLNAQFRAATSELLLSNNNNSLVLVGE